MTIRHRHPADPAAFERYDRERHVPIASQMPEARVELTLCAPGPDDAAPPCYRVAELYFADAAQMEASPAGAPEASVAP